MKKQRNDKNDGRATENLNEHHRRIGPMSLGKCQTTQEEQMEIQTRRVKKVMLEIRPSRTTLHGNFITMRFVSMQLP